MKEKILQEARKHAEEAKKHAEEARKAGRIPIEFTLKSGETSSLGKMIQTKEQADFFMKILRSL
jgi:hypothetical protein